ncbi:hypothetical protein ACMGT0_19475 [Pseudomonas sp. RHF3.3-3]|uniref:Uncharacterized protein n=1 Tax=Pseudomonas asplenii TaxID=53407 RepID=A0A0M9GD51_9PSED|nr:hypothetical protein [Pseudomonas fuscovaginae]KPA88147.1 hypothetical protein PF66_05379 [Pseudomonas fuscovaginae]
MTLIIPVNVQALRVSTNDASLVTKSTELFCGATTNYGGLPWREPDPNGAIVHSGTWTKANVSTNTYNPMNQNVIEQLKAGIHLHWALPDSIAQGRQAPDGTVDYPPAPNRWLVTRIIQQSQGTQVKQWVVESDYLMTPEQYRSEYYPASQRNSISLPVGWDVPPGYDVEGNGGAAYYPPSRRMGRVFELRNWQPTPDAPGAALTDVRHLPAFVLSPGNFMAAGQNLGSISALGNSGPTFSAYYPDCASAFGFHDTFLDLEQDKPQKWHLDNVQFQVSYQVSGWHSSAADDPLQGQAFRQALAVAEADNANRPADRRLTPAQVFAQVVQGFHGWQYQPTVDERPSRCLYSAQVAGIPWNTTGQNPLQPNTRPGFPKCYLAPLTTRDETVRAAMGSSSSSALAALIKEQWSGWKPQEPQGDLPPASDEIEHNLEFLLDALQMGLLERLGRSLTLVQLEQEVHQNGFGALQSGRIWMIRQKQTGSGSPYAAPQVVLPDDSNQLAEKLNSLNLYQQRLDALLNIIVSCRQQIFMDWYKYITGLYDETGSVPFDVTQLNSYLAEQILDLWAKFEAAFGKSADASPATGNIPVFPCGPQDFLSQAANGTYLTKASPQSLVGQLVSQANTLVGLLASDYSQFELQTTNAARFWQPNEPVLVVTGDSLQPARRNGNVKSLPCRLGGQLLSQVGTAAGARLTATVLQGSLALGVPQVNPGQGPEARDLQPILADLALVLGEKSLLDPLLAPQIAGALNGAPVADVLAAQQALIGKIQQAWTVNSSAPWKTLPIIENPSATGNGLTLTWSGQAPQGLALNHALDWQDPFLPLFLVWEASYVPFEHNRNGVPNYSTDYITEQFQLDEREIELVQGKTPAQPVQSQVKLSDSILLSSRIAEPLIEQLRRYLQDNDNPELQAIVQYLLDKPLLAQGLSGVNAGFLTRAAGLQLNPFNPFYDEESTPGALVDGFDNTQYINSLTHFVAWAAGEQTGQVPITQQSLYNLLRAGFFTLSKLQLVDVFGRRRDLIDTEHFEDSRKVTVSWQMQAPDNTAGKAYLAPRVAQPSRLLFRWLSAENDEVQMNPVPSTSPLCGWIVPNYLENALMLFTGTGEVLGSLGVFGAQQRVTWHSAPGNAARSMQQDLADANPHLVKLATFIQGKPRDFFAALLGTFDNAHTYILPDDKQAAQAQAVLMGQPLALVRASLRYEIQGLPASVTSSEELARLLPTQSDKTYDWTQRDSAGIGQVDIPVRLGDRDHLEDGLVAYLLDGETPYTTLYAPAAPTPAVEGIERPAADTITLNLRANIDPPARPYADARAQIADLRNVHVPLQKTLSLLVDPRARVHATTGLLPVKAIGIPPDITAAALRNIEMTFFTHPILRSRQGLSLPVPPESGFVWEWTTSVLRDGQQVPHDEALPPSQTGDRASFSYTPQTAEDGWLKLKPAPQTE